MRSNHIAHVLIMASTMASEAVAHRMSVKRSPDARHYGRHASGRINMPGHMMTKAGKRWQMQRDFERCNRRKGKPRP